MINYSEIKKAILNSESLESLPSEFRPPVPKCADDENYVFISYSHRDYKAVYCDLLEFHKKGVRYWYDYGLTPGEDWVKEVIKRLDDANCTGVIFYLSENFVLSLSTLAEVRAVLGDGESPRNNYFTISLSSELPEDLVWKALGGKSKSGLRQLGIDDVRAHEDIFNRAFPNEKTNIIKQGNESDKHISLVIDTVVKKFNVVVTGVAISENEAFQELQGRLDFANTFSIKDGILYRYLGREEKVIIPEGVRAIGEKAFDHCDFIKEVVIPDGVTVIGSGAFDNCTFIKDIMIPNSVTEIGSFAFANCRNLETVTLPEGLTSIGSDAFFSCGSLMSITVPESVTKIGRSAFFGCYNLIDDIGNVEYVGKWAVGTYGMITSLSIKDGTVGIADDTFGYREDLKSVTIPSSVHFIGKYAFSECKGLKKITLPEGLTSIGEYSFAGCSGLKKIIIPDGVKSIGESAFVSCLALKSVSVPDSVISIGEQAFENCPSLKYKQKNGVKYLGNSNHPYIVAISADKKIMSASLPSTVKSVSPDAFFGCADLKSIMLPDSVTSICGSAFAKCSGLVSIEIPEGVKHIGICAFSGCTGLADITVSENNTVYSSDGNCLIDTVKKKLIIGCKNSVIPTDGSVTSIDDEAFLACEELKEIVIPKWVTDIGAAAFARCKKLESITLPDGITRIENYVFNECESLTSVTIPKSVCSIGNGAFAYSKLENIYFGGTASEWGAINKGNGWDSGAPAYTVHCTDGDIQKKETEEI